jgi:hypothetical protein
MMGGMKGLGNVAAGLDFVAECGDVGQVQYVDAVGGSLVVKGVEGREGCVIAKKTKNLNGPPHENRISGIFLVLKPTNARVYP